ncbi:MAG TPA: flavin reductase family protein [Streptosporangiaceae bacterium]
MPADGTDPPDAFDAIMASLDAPLVIVTAAASGERAGCLVGFHGQSSIAPQRYCVWLSKANRTYQVALGSEHLGIGFLSAADHDLAERFGTLTGDDTDKFAGLDVAAGPGGVPVLRRWPAWLAVRRTALLDEGGDHVCVVTEPVAAHAGQPFTPLRVSQARDLVPGHDTAEAPRPGQPAAP